MKHDRPSATAVAASLARWSEPSPRGHDRFDDYDYDDLVVVPAHSAAPLGAGAPQRGAFVPQSSKCPSAAPMHGPAAQVCAAAHSGEVDEQEKCAQDLDSRPASEASTAALAARRQEVWRALQAPASDPSLPIADALRALREQLNRRPMPSSSREEEEALRTRSCSTLRGHVWKVLIGGCLLWGGGGHGGSELQISCSDYLGAVSDRASAMCVLIRASPMHMELNY
jgi:hypothetical protein